MIKTAVISTMMYLVEASKDICDTQVSGILWFVPKYVPVERGGTLVESMTFNRRVVGSTPALAAT